VFKIDPFGNKFLQKFTTFASPDPKIVNRTPAKCSILSISLAIEVPDTGHWWMTASGQDPPDSGRGPFSTDQQGIDGGAEQKCS
jgi:hypothetical protein